MKLAAFEQRWFAEIFAAILPSNADALPGADTLPMASYAADLVASAPARTAFGFRAAAWIIVLLGALLSGRLRPFLTLPRDEQAAVLSSLARSPVYLIRELPTLMKVLATMGWAGVPDIQRQLGVTRVDTTPPHWARPATDQRDD